MEIEIEMYREIEIDREELIKWIGKMVTFRVVRSGFPVIRGDSRIPATLVSLSKTSGFATWSRPKTLWSRFRSVFGPFSVRFGSVPFVSLRFEPLFQNFASCLHKKHGFAKRLSRFCAKKMQFWTPKWPQKGYFCHRWSLLSALGPFGKPFLPVLSHPGICKIRWKNVLFFV